MMSYTTSWDTIDDGEARVVQEVWTKQGDVVNWLVSDAFGLQQARSVAAERAIEAAEAWMRDERVGLPEDLDTEKKIHKELTRLLPGADHFWPRWIVSVERGVEKSKGERT